MSTLRKKIEVEFSRKSSETAIGFSGRGKPILQSPEDGFRIQKQPTLFTLATEHRSIMKSDTTATVVRMTPRIRPILLILLTSAKYIYMSFCFHYCHKPDVDDTYDLANYERLFPLLPQARYNTDCYHISIKSQK